MSCLVFADEGVEQKEECRREQGADATVSRVFLLSLLASQSPPGLGGKRGWKAREGAGAGPSAETGSVSKIATHVVANGAFGDSTAPRRALLSTYFAAAELVENPARVSVTSPPERDSILGGTQINFFLRPSCRSTSSSTSIPFPLRLSSTSTSASTYSRHPFAYHRLRIPVHILSCAFITYRIHTRPTRCPPDTTAALTSRKTTPSSTTQTPRIPPRPTKTTTTSHTIPTTDMSSLIHHNPRTPMRWRGVSALLPKPQEQRQTPSETTPGQRRLRPHFPLEAHTLRTASRQTTTT